MLHVLAQKLLDQTSYKEGNKTCLPYFYIIVYSLMMGLLG